MKYPVINKKSDRRIICDSYEHQVQVLTYRTINTLSGEWSEAWEDRGSTVACDCNRKDTE